MENDLILSIQHVDVQNSDDDAYARELLSGPIGTMARVSLRRIIEDEDGEQRPEDIVLYIERIDMNDLEDEVTEETGGE